MIFLKYCGRVERLVKRMLMLIGVFSVLYVVTYNYHLMTVNIVSRDVSYIQGTIFNETVDRAELSVVHRRNIENIEHTDAKSQPKNTNEGRVELPEDDDNEGSDKDESPGAYEEETGAEKLALDDPNHPQAKKPAPVFDANDNNAGDEEYEGGADEDNHAPVAHAATTGNVKKTPANVRPKTTIPTLHSSGPEGKPSVLKHYEKGYLHNTHLDLADAKNKPGVKLPITEPPIDPSHCARKLEILDQRLDQLAQQIVQVTFKHGRPSKNSTASKNTCIRYRNEARIKSRYNVTNIWSTFKDTNLDDITLVTQMTPNRIAVLSQLAAHWTGPISAAIYIKRENLTELTQIFRKNIPLLNRKNLELHIVIASGEFYPVNFLRNVALKAAVTKYVYLSDVDFVPSHGLHENLKSRIDQGLLENRTVLVVPGFQLKKSKNSKFPADKSELLQMWKKKKIEPFHWYFRFGHRATNFGKWRKTTEPYYIKWEDGFEPYILGKRDELPLYSQRFLSRVRNKTSQIAEIYYMGFWFKVLPDVFTIHMPHSVSKRNTYYYWCSANAYGSFTRNLKKKYPAKKFRSRVQPTS